MIFDVALSAGKHAGVDLLCVVAERLGHVGMRDRQVGFLAFLTVRIDLVPDIRRISVAGIAAYAFRAASNELRMNLLKILAVHAAVLFDKLREVRRFAGQTVRHLRLFAVQLVKMRTLRCQNVVHRKRMAAGFLVVVGKAVLRVQRLEVRIRLQIVFFVGFLIRGRRVHGVGNVLVDVGSLRPVIRRDDAVHAGRLRRFDCLEAFIVDIVA